MTQLTSAIIDIVVQGLGKRQIKTILSLTDEWGKAYCHKTAKRMFYSVGGYHLTVVFHKHQTDNCWCLSDVGLIIKQKLIDAGHTL